MVHSFIRTIFTVLFLLGTLAVGQESTPDVKITNPKLTTINMGLDAIDYWIEKLPSADSRRAQSLIRDLKRLENRFKRVPPSQEKQYIYIQDRLLAARKTLEARAAGLRAKKTAATSETDTSSSESIPHRNLRPLRNQLESVENEHTKLSIADARSLRKFAASVAELRNTFNRIPKSDHPDHLNTESRIGSLEASVSKLIPASGLTNEQAESLLRQMHKKYFENLKLPEARKMMRTRELTGQDIEYFVGGLQKFRSERKNDLPGIKAASVQFGGYYDLVKHLEQTSESMIEREIKTLSAYLDNLINNAVRDAEAAAKLDPQKNRYAFVTESVRKNYEDTFARNLRTLEQARVLEESLGLPAKWSSHRTNYETFIAQYRTKAESAGIVKRLPQDIGDPQLAKTAQATLKKKKYGVGKIVKLVVNARTVPRDRIETRYFNGALETVVRKWDEYQVVTVENENGEFYVYYNTLRNFSRGPATTPINEWILANRYKTGKIATDAIK